MLRIVGEQPALEPLIHHGGFDFEMERRRATIFERPWIELAFNCRRVIDNLQTGAAREGAEILRMLRTGRMMQKLRRITFDDSIDIVNAKLVLIDQQSIRRRFAFEKCDRPFDTKNPADERANQKRDD